MIKINIFVISLFITNCLDPLIAGEIEVSSNAAAAIKQNPDGHKQTYISSESKAKTSNSGGQNYKIVNNNQEYPYNGMKILSESDAKGNKPELLTPGKDANHIELHPNIINPEQNTKHEEMNPNIINPEQNIKNEEMHPNIINPEHNIKHEEMHPNIINSEQDTKHEEMHPDYIPPEGKIDKLESVGLTDSLETNANDSLQDKNVEHSWGYYDSPMTYGMDKWSKEWPKCASKIQSPINIDTKNLREVHEFNGAFGNKSLSFNTLTINDGRIHGYFINNGKSIGFIVNQKRTKSVSSGGPLFNEKYILEQFHFHSSCSLQEDGSEHSVDNKFYPGEIHFVFKNKKFSNISEATMDSEGIAVIAFFIEPEEKLNSLEPKFIDLNNVVKNIMKPNTKYERMDGFSIDLFRLRRNIAKDYYFYKGSLTTPPCTGGVTWIVMKNPLKVNLFQFNQLFKPEGYNNGKTCGNRRNIQNSGDILVYHSEALKSNFTNV